MTVAGPRGIRPPLPPMRAAPVSGLPARRDVLLEPKFDGWRCLAWTFPDRVLLQSRQGRTLSGYFPDLTRLMRGYLPVGVVVDGELVVWDPVRERTSFTALQQRVVAGRRLPMEIKLRPAHYVLFDLLVDPDGEHLNQPLTARRARLEQLLAGAPPQLQLCPQTTDPAEARVWMTDWAAAGVEGIVIKDPAGRYEPGQARWGKFKTRATTEAVVGGVTGTISQPDTLLLGRYDPHGRLRYVGRTRPLPGSDRGELAAVLRPLVAQRPGVQARHPWPQPLPAAWSGQFGERRRPLPYTPVEPAVVVEVDVDVAFDDEAGRWRHRVGMVRVRADLSPFDVAYRAGAGF